MIQLDTNFLIQALVPGSAAEGRLNAWLTSGEDVGISTIAWSEFLCGPLTPSDEALAQALFAAPEPFLVTDARKAADLFNATGRRSRTARLPQWRCDVVQASRRQRFGLCTVYKSRLGSGLRTMSEPSFALSRIRAHEQVRSRSRNQ